MLSCCPHPHYECFPSRRRSNYRIIEDSLSKRFVISRAPEENIAYVVGEYLEELVGEIKPIGWTTNCKMTMDLARPDVGLTCRVYYGRRNNWTRHIKYSANPTAELVVVPLHGRYRMVFRALADIKDGVTITVGVHVNDTCACQVCNP